MPPQKLADIQRGSLLKINHDQSEVFRNRLTSKLNPLHGLYVLRKILAATIQMAVSTGTVGSQCRLDGGEVCPCRSV